MPERASDSSSVAMVHKPPPLPKSRTQPQQAEAEAAQAAEAAVAHPAAESIAAPDARTPSTEAAPAESAKPAHDHQPALAPRGVVHDASKRWTVYWLAAAVAGVAVLNVALFVTDAVLDAQQLRPTGVANWALVLLLLGIVQGVYAFYLFQLPDWSSVWVVSIVMLIAAAAFAMLLAVLALGGGNTPLATALGLNEFGDLRPELVCLIMLALTGLLSYLLGRTSFRWHKSDAALAAATARK